MQKIKPAMWLIVLVVLFFLSFTGAAWGAEGDTAIVTGKIVNIRVKPDTTSTSTIITQVTLGEELVVLGNQGNWYKVTAKSGKTGWISGDWVEIKQKPKEEQKTENTSFVGNEVKVTIDGRVVEFDASPYIDNQQRTMVPIRFVANELGSKVDWDQDQQMVTISGNGKTVQLWIGHAIARVNAEEVSLDTMPVLKDGRTMVPLRFVGDNLGLLVGWDGEENTVVLTTKRPTPGGSSQGNESNARIALITGSVVNVRTGPGLEHEVITQAKKGEALTILGDTEDWFYVKSKDGYQGWVSNSLVAVRIDPNAPSRSPEPGDRPRPLPPLYTGPNVLKDIEIKDLGNELELVIFGEHPLNYSIMALGDPQRVVLDFYNTTLDLKWATDSKAVNNEIATAIRVGQFTENQARVVVDLKSVVSHGVSFNEKGSQLIVKLKPPSIKDKIIVIDPGHGEIKPWGSDPGAIGKNGLQERDLNTDIAWKLWEILKREGATLIMTRTGDTTSLDLAGRAAVANENNADIFVCIHINSSTSAGVAGTSTFYYAPWNSELGAQRAERQRLATLVQQELVTSLGRRNIGIVEENFAVLRETTMPSVLAEIAFMSNPEELKLLGTEEFRMKAAEGLARGIIRYFAEQ